MGSVEGKKSTEGRFGRLSLRLTLSSFCVVWIVVACVQSQPGPVNIAKGLPESSYSMSSNYKPQQFRSSVPASFAANENTSGDYSEKNCIHTSHTYNDQWGRQSNDLIPWWQVDLGSSFQVFHFKIWGRTGQISRLYPFTITVDDEECVTVERSPGSREISVTCTRPLLGRLVRLTKLYTRHWDYLLNMCEFQIWACNDGYYGVGCDLNCSDNCSSEGCFMDDGKCVGCDSGLYGEHCANQCSAGCSGMECDHVTGHCTNSSCLPGWVPENDKCDDELPGTSLSSSTPWGTSASPPNAFPESTVTTTGPQSSGVTSQQKSFATPLASLDSPSLFHVNDKVAEDTWVKYLQSQISKNDLQMAIMKEKLKESKQRQRIFDLRQSKMMLKIAALEDRAFE